VRDILSDKYSIYAPKNSYCSIFDPRRLADKAEVHGCTRQEGRTGPAGELEIAVNFDPFFIAFYSNFQALCTKSRSKKDFELNRTINNFVSKYYKEKPSIRG
jgi:hypothetical protein